MAQDRTSVNSLAEATRSRAKFSGHGGALGAAGRREVSYNPENSSFLREPGQSIAVSPGPEGFASLTIGASWHNVQLDRGNFFTRFFKKVQHAGVDLDIGCLYELEDGSRGVIQAFGEQFGSFENAPYMALSGDDRTGDAPGNDEYIQVNGHHWDKIKRLLIYLYIYDGVATWADVKPEVIVDVPGENDLVVTLSAYQDNLPVCAVGGLENVRGGIKLINYTEYFPGHAEMDRAFGFGLEWEDGRK